MRKARQLCVASLLTLILTFPALAGEIQLPGVASPPPQQPSVTGEMACPGASVAGQMDTGLASDADSVAEIALNFLVNALSVF
jgi:hypothetical protein